MDDDKTSSTGHAAGDVPEVYEPPELICLGTVADLTAQKQVGAADGATFLGLDIGS